MRFFSASSFAAMTEMTLPRPCIDAERKESATRGESRRQRPRTEPPEELSLMAYFRDEATGIDCEHGGDGDSDLNKHLQPY